MLFPPLGANCMDAVLLSSARRQLAGGFAAGQRLVAGGILLLAAAHHLAEGDDAGALVCFQPTTGAMKVYTTSNGLLGDQFNYHASLETEDGTIYLGSIDGFIAVSYTHLDVYKRQHLGQWRCWYDFGVGALGDWGAHILDTAHEFLELGLPYEVTMQYANGCLLYTYRCV